MELHKQFEVFLKSIDSEFNMLHVKHELSHSKRNKTTFSYPYGEFSYPKATIIFVLSSQKKCLYAKIKNDNGLYEFASIQFNDDKKINLIKLYLREDNDWILQNTYVINFEGDFSLNIHHQMEENKLTESYFAKVKFNKLAQVESIYIVFFEFKGYERNYQLYYTDNLCSCIEVSENKETFSYFFEYNNEQRLIKYTSIDKENTYLEKITYFKNLYEQEIFKNEKLINKVIYARNNKLLESTSFYYAENSSMVYARNEIVGEHKIIISKSINYKDWECLGYAIFNKPNEYCKIYNALNECIYTVFFCESTFENLELKNERCWYNKNYQLINEISVSPNYLLSLVDYTKNTDVLQ